MNSESEAREARRLVELRDRWLNPPEWVECVDDPIPGYPKRPVPRDEATAKALKKSTLTNLYNAWPQWLWLADALWSDLHLGQTKTIEVLQRPFGTADEMNETIFRNWEQVVAPADTILILGDVTVTVSGAGASSACGRPQGGGSSCTGTTRSPARAWWRPTVSTKFTAACT